MQKTRGHRIIFIKSGSSHDHHSLEIHCSSSLELSVTPPNSMILVYFRGKEVSVLPETFETALVDILNHDTTNFAFSYLKQAFKKLSTFLPYRDIKGLDT